MHFTPLHIDPWFLDILTKNINTFVDILCTGKTVKGNSENTKCFFPRQTLFFVLGSDIHTSILPSTHSLFFFFFEIDLL